MTPAPRPLANGPVMALVQSIGEPSPRRNLVIVRAGDGSVHNRWGRDIADADRTWSLLVSFFGEDEAALQPPYEYIARHKGQKWPAVFELAESGELPPFDFVWCVDDDIDCDWSTVNRLFELVARHGLDLAQPALGEGSYVAHAVTRRRPDCLLRYTSFVEVMAPVFSRAAFETCAPPMPFAKSGWGLDFVWPKLLGYPRDRIAILDAVPVRHTRPVGSRYALHAAAAEMAAMMKRFGAQRRIGVYGELPVAP